MLLLLTISIIIESIHLLNKFYYLRLIIWLVGYVNKNKHIFSIFLHDLNIMFMQCYENTIDFIENKHY